MPLEEPSACDLYGQENQPAYELDCAKPDGIGAILALPQMSALMAINFLVMLGFNFFYAAFPIHAIEGLNWDVTQIGIYFAVLSLGMIVVEGPVSAKIGKVFSDKALMSFGGACLAVGFVALLNLQTGTVYASALLIALGNGLMWPTFMAVLSKAAGERLQGAVQGYAQSAGAVASIAGLIAGGIGYVVLGPGLFLFAASAIAASALLALNYRPLGVTTPRTTGSPQKPE